MIEEVKQLILLEEKVCHLLSKARSATSGRTILATGVAGSYRSLIVGLMAESTGKQIMLVNAENQKVQMLRDDISLALGASDVRSFSGSKSHSAHDRFAPSDVGDVETLRALLNGNVRVIIADAAALCASLPSPHSLKDQVVTIERGKEYNFTDLWKHLSAYGFEKKHFVETVGDFSLRGGIMDVFPFVGENPIRIEFSGDTVESIREFDPLSQRSVKELSMASLVPDLLAADRGETSAPHQATLLDYLHPDAIIILDEPESVLNRVEEEFARKAVRSSREEVVELLQMFPQIHFLQVRDARQDVIDCSAISQPSINSSVRILKGHLSHIQTAGFALYITSDTTAEQARLMELLQELESSEAEEERSEQEPRLDLSRISFSTESLHEGFVVPNARIAVFTEHQIFGRQKRRGKQRRPVFKGISQRDLLALRKGDFVVHADYGIGRFDGLKKITVRDIEQEVVKLLYEERDTLYLNLNYINKIQKYASKEGHVPKLTRLGSGEWDKLKARAKKRVKDIARDLITLYARRKQAEGFAFHKDTLWQRELEASFMYEDTPDQEKATIEVKADMEATYPMDRLVCGDVGFGKTEIAVRAAFKAVMSGKQVALLVPTTILAEQHYNTFLDRLSKYTTRVEVLSRFKSKKEQNEVVDRLKSGSTDIVIGTHRLLSKDIRFKNLGLLIIDEEHRFGVAAKEKLRQMKANVDTLTLTATPIPRTLHFSLMGARDLSLIVTPPPNRLPVMTEIAEYNDDHVREAILREIHRGGQVFFVHDRVHSMDEAMSRLQASLPHVRFRQAHGQMHAHELEAVMLAFLERKFDVLVATKIIESGLDIPNVNTIIINRADRFGMADLYQLRGRVGRSNVQAFAYLLTPPLSILPKEAIRRLQAIGEFSELGSGFNLAMRDLEIRGAGNLLGGEQSGFIESMGFDMYTRILEEAMTELKEQEFAALFEQHAAQREQENQATVEADIDVHIPEVYIESDNERLLIYRQLYAVTGSAQLDEIAAELKDRFGKFPTEVENLFNLVRVRLKATALGFRKVIIREKGVIIDFPPDSETRFYEAESFQRLMTSVSQKKSKGTKLCQTEQILQLSSLFDISDGINPLRQTEYLLDELKEAMERGKDDPATV